MSECMGLKHRVNYGLMWSVIMSPRLGNFLLFVKYQIFFSFFYFIRWFLKSKVKSKKKYFKQFLVPPPCIGIKLTALSYNRYMLMFDVTIKKLNDPEISILWVIQCMHMEFRFKINLFKRISRRSSSSIKVIVTVNESINLVEIFLKCRLIKLSSTTVQHEVNHSLDGKYDLPDLFSP